MTLDGWTARFSGATSIKWCSTRSIHERISRTIHMVNEYTSSLGTATARVTYHIWSRLTNDRQSSAHTETAERGRYRRACSTMELSPERLRTRLPRLP